MGGGGGGSGKIDWPGYLKRHQKWGLLRVQNYLDEYSEGGAPKRQHFDPNLYFGSKPTFTAMGLLGELHDMDPDSMFEAAYNAYTPRTQSYDGWMQHASRQMAAWQADADTDTTEAIIENVRERSRQEVEENVLPRAEQGFRDIGAVNTIGFSVMRAMVWQEHVRKTDEIDAELTYRQKTERQQQELAIAMRGPELESIGLGYAQLKAEVAIKRAGFQMTSKETLIKIADGIFADAASFKMKANAILDEEQMVGKKWKLEGMRYYAEMLASISGGIPMRPEETLSTTRAAVAGAAGGAGAAVAAGQPWWAGALVGGFMGAVGN